MQNQPKDAALLGCPAALPKVAWIELTSKCPLDCIFCTRRSVHGAGRDMDFDVFRSVVEQLGCPERICLNHSGESIVYPRLADAIRLTKSAGAKAELVTALCPARGDVLAQVFAAGLDHMRISVHTVDAELFPRMYGRMTLDAMQRAVARVMQLREEMHARTEIDFAFVPTKHNVDELPAVAEYALRSGVSLISVFPVMQRDIIVNDFSEELNGNRPRAEFGARLRSAVARSRATFPQIEIQVVNEDAFERAQLGAIPRYCAGELPAGARVSGCDESPWDTIHILANGDVMACEEHIRDPLGNLSRQPLAEVWHGPRYAAFRREFELGINSLCRTCPRKMAYVPDELHAIVQAERDGAQFVRGWHTAEPGGARWSRPEAVLVLSSPGGRRSLHLAGILPPSSGRANRLSIIAGGLTIGTVTNSGSEPLSFDSTFTLPALSSATRHIQFHTSNAYCPQASGASSDIRLLGFALIRAEIA